MNASRKIDIIFAFLTAAVITAAVCYLYLPKPEPLVQKSVKILFVGDLLFDRGIRYYADKNGGNDFIFKKISSALAGNDLVVANLEGPITNNKSVSAGTVVGSPDNYFFTFDPSVATTLFKENIKMVDLGNNHILNFGQTGLTATKKYLTEAGVGYFGDSSSDSKSTSTVINGIKVAFVGYNQFSGLTDGKEEQATIDEIKKVRGTSDIVVVFSHWGVEYDSAPTSAMKALAHQFIDAGADVVVGSHSHVIGQVEAYKGKRIYYSLGNFIFDQYFSEEVRNGLGVKVKIDGKTKQLDFSETHFYLDTNGQTVEKTQGK